MGGKYEELDGIIPPPPTKEQLISELEKIQLQIENPYNPDQVQEDLDKNYQALFVDLLSLHGIEEKEEKCKEMVGYNESLTVGSYIEKTKKIGGRK